MARPLRVQFFDAYYHIIKRCRRGEQIFKSKDDYERFNSTHSLDRQLYRGRYKAILSYKGNYLLQLIRYIHRNPVHASIVNKAEKARSSHKGYRSEAKKWDWLRKQFILSMLAKEPHKNGKRYREFMSKDEDKGKYSACFLIF